MKGYERLESVLPRTRRAFAFGAMVALLVLGLTVLLGFVFVRHLVRNQIIQRDAEALHAATLMEQLDVHADPGSSVDTELGFEAALRASRLRGVIGIRFFDTNGVFQDAFPATIQPKALAPDDLTWVRRSRPFSRYLRNLPLDQVFIYLPQFATGNVARVSILEAAVPLQTGGTNPHFSGAAQFVLEASAIAAEYRRLDHYLASLALLGFAVSGTLLVGMLWPAFHKMELLNRSLAERGERLAEANQKLALAARSSALGAISAHLMHGLKNPLASVSHYFRVQAGGEPASFPTDAQDALAAAKRMQSLVDDTLEVLGDAQGQPAYDLSLAELIETVKKKTEPLAAEKKVLVRAAELPAYNLISPVANQAGLILVNLVENAIQASPAGAEVSLRASLESARLLLRVQDRGPGIPSEMQPLLFLPCRSTRQGGSGLGLAISRQIADHLGAELALEQSSRDGSTFLLALPLEA